MNTLMKLVGVSLATALLVACNNDGVKIPDDHLISIDKTLLMNESSKKIFEFKTISDDVKLSVDSIMPSNAASLSLEGNRLIVESRNLDRPGLISASLYSGKGKLGDSTTKSFEIVVKNSSAKSMEMEVERALISRGDLLSLREDREVFEFFVDVAYINKLISHSEKEAIINGFDPLSSPYYDQLSSDFLTLNFQYSKYNNAQISDVELKVYLETLQNSLKSHGEYSKSKILEINSYYLPMIPEFTNGTLVYHLKDDKFSKYIGNQELGAYSNNKWEFSPEYTILQALLD